MHRCSTSIVITWRELVLQPAGSRRLRRIFYGYKFKPKTRIAPHALYETILERCLKNYPVGIATCTFVLFFHYKPLLFMFSRKISASWARTSRDTDSRRAFLGFLVFFPIPRRTHLAHLRFPRPSHLDNLVRHSGLLHSLVVIFFLLQNCNFVF